MPSLIDALQGGLGEPGYVEGKNLKVEYRFGGPQSEPLDAIASELVELHPDAIVTQGTPATFAAKRATTTIPIAMAPVGGPVRIGLVASLGPSRSQYHGCHAVRVRAFGASVWKYSRSCCQQLRASATQQALPPSFGRKRRNWRLR